MDKLKLEEKEAIDDYLTGNREIEDDIDEDPDAEEVNESEGWGNDD